ncbi:MAG: S8 family serine peptidase [Polyangiales bacterium]
MPVRRALFPVLFGLVSIAITPTGAAPAVASVQRHTRVDPFIASAFAFRRKSGLTPPAFRRSERFERDGVLPIVVRFDRPLDDAKVASLARAGVEWERSGAPLTNGAYAAKIDESAFKLLSAEPSLVRLSIDLPRNAPLPLDASAKETGIDAVRRSLRAKDGKLLDGTGTKIADIDSGVFVFHPTFFRADAGVYAWTDVDGDGKLTPGKDGVDLDGSGTIEPGEVLRELSAQGYDEHGGGFQPAVDWLYLDTNGNGQRDYGKEFGETTPAYGEPLFIVDDVNQDAEIAPSEKLLRLGTSKIAAVKASRVYTRGNTTSGIAAYGSTLLKNAQFLDYASHGTGVAGILVGGVQDRSKLLGLAPGAELYAVGYGSNDPSGTVASVQWAIDQKVDVILTEYAPYVGYPLDGSTEEETLLDSAVDAGIAVVNPAGNLAKAVKHTTKSLVAGVNTITIDAGKGFNGSYYAGITILHRGDPRTLKLTLNIPGGTKVDIPADSSTDPIPAGTDRTVDVIRETTARGTHAIHLQLAAYSGGTFGNLPSGKYTLDIDADAPVDVDMYCGDAVTSWGDGLVFTENTTARTVCHPATNDKGIAVAAYTLHATDLWGEPTAGDLAYYSSLGPRIDGTAGIDLAAPDDPWSATVPADPTDHGALYSLFGGTSGAGPHVAASLALLKQNQPMLGGAALQDLLLSSARKDSFVDGDENKWGKGKLDVAAALKIPRKEGSPPKVTLVVPADLRPGSPIELRADVVDDGGGLRARWDLDYDGKPDTDWEAIAPKTITEPSPTTRFVRVDVLDADGYVRGATAKLVIAAKADEPTPAADTPAPSSSSGCSCTTPAGRTSSYGALAALLLLVTPRLRRGVGRAARRDR